MASAPRSTRSLSVGDALKGAPGAPAPQSSVSSCEEGGGGGGERRALSLIFRYRAQGWSEHQRPLYQRVINVLNLEPKECVCQRLTVEGLRGRVHTHKADRSVRGITLSTQNCIQAGSCPQGGLGHINKHNSESSTLRTTSRVLIRKLVIYSLVHHPFSP